jgi:hypothetical protein
MMMVTASLVYFAMRDPQVAMFPLDVRQVVLGIFMTMIIVS